MRSITIGDEKWRYNIGKEVTVIRRPDNTVFGKVANNALVGVTPDTFARGKYKRTSDGMVKPSHIAAFIKAEIARGPRTSRNPLLDERISPHAGYVTPAPRRGRVRQ